MRLTRPTVTRFMGRAIVGAIWLALLVLVAVFGVIYAVYADFKAPDRSHLSSLTHSEYLADVIYGRFRSSWGITPDAQLAYVPKVGASRIYSPEYDVTMTYDHEGARRQPAVAGPRGKLVVMAGDSFTAGLGVEDHETFSALLQSRHHHATVNTGVISYGTARELWRLRRLNLLTRGEVLVIQYCDNDADENRRFLARPFEAIGQTGNGESWTIGRRQEYLELSYLNVFRASVQQLRLLTGIFGYRKVAEDIWGERQSLGTPIIVRDFTPEQLAADFLACWIIFPK